MENMYMKVNLSVSLFLKSKVFYILFKMAMAVSFYDKPVADTKYFEFCCEDISIGL